MSSTSQSRSPGPSALPSSISAPSTSASPTSCYTASTGPFTLAQSPLFSLHQRARSAHPLYPPRAPVPDSAVSFSIPLPSYHPPSFTVPSTLSKSPDPASPPPPSAWSSRPPSSHPFSLDPSSHAPLNPFGRTGLAGRGKLYYWGPNHAADCILMRRTEDAPLLLTIRRSDTGEYAVMGGMIDKGEKPEATVRREFAEEVLGVKEGEGWEAKLSAQQRRVLDAVFEQGHRRVAYRGYVDDGRNTDNAWIETCAFMFDLPESVGEDELRLFKGGSDATEVRWIPARDGDEQFDKLYASHKPMVLLAMQQQSRL